jgi:hypothetical protein
MKNYLCVIIASLLLVQGCGLFDDDDQGSLTPLEGLIKVEVKEYYPDYTTVSDPQLYLQMVTEKIYPCMNYGISNTLVTNPGRIDVNIHGIFTPDICLTALGPAGSMKRLNAPQGNYRLTFRYAGAVDEYNMTINKSFVRLEPVNRVHTVSENLMYHRYPEKSFAYLCGTTLQDTALCRMFIDTVASIINIQRFEFPETGAIPYPSASQGYYYNMPAQYYYYETEEDFEKIGSIMESFRNTYIKDKTGIGISVINWRNRNFYSWR